MSTLCSLGLSLVLLAATDPCQAHQEVILQMTSPIRKLRPLGRVHKEVMAINHRVQRDPLHVSFMFSCLEYLIKGQGYFWCSVAGILQ